MVGPKAKKGKNHTRYPIIFPLLHCLAYSNCQKDYNRLTISNI